MIFVLKHWRLVAGVFVVLVSAYLGYTAGINGVKADQLATLKKYQTENRELASELEVEKAKIKIETIETVRVIERETDPTGCIDTTVPDGVLSSIRDRTDRPLSNF
jgi:hypothetical protein